MPATPHILITGDGIAGRAMALAWARAGYHATIIAPKSPKAHTSTAQMGGVQIAPNGWAALDGLGLADAVQHCACPLSMMRLLSADTGNTLVSIDLTAAHRHPYAGVDRAGLMAVLKAAAKDTKRVTWHNGVAAHLSHPRLSHYGDHASVTLEDGSTLTAPYIFGADGGNGIARAYIQAADTPPPLTETRRAFRSMIPLDELPPLLHAKATSVWLGDGGHMVFYPLPPRAKGQMGHLNLVAVTTSGTSARRQAVALGQALSRAQPDFEALLPYLETAADMPLYRYPSLDALRRGRVILVGDAAHPMPPHLAQGAGQSLIDANSIQHVLHGAADDTALNAGLTEWTAARLKATKRIQETAHRAGKLFALDGPLTRIRNIGLASIGGIAMERELDRIWRA